MLDVAVRVGVGFHRQPVPADPEPVCGTPAQQAKLVVVGVVLHHEHHDVLDLGDGIGTLGEVRVR